MRGRGSATSNWHQKNYHLGFTEDLSFIVDYAIKKKHFEEVVLIGFSMGANIVLKYLGEQAPQLNAAIKGSVAFSAPIEIVSCGDRIDDPSKKFYSLPLLRQAINATVGKVSMLAPYVDVDRLLKVRTWREFDEIYTTPVFGFDSVLEYRKQASALPILGNINVPSLLISAKDDPMLSKECFLEKDMLQKHPHLFGEFPDNGGHLGFVRFEKNGLLWSEQRALDFVDSL
jgi:predicted alpha/beta-fold hydrolase